MDSYRGEFAVGHPDYPEGSEAASKPAKGPVAIEAPSVKYTPEDDKAIDDYHRKNGMPYVFDQHPYSYSLTPFPVATSWHSVRTCLAFLFIN